MGGGLVRTPRFTLEGPGCNSLGNLSRSCCRCVSRIGQEFQVAMDKEHSVGRHSHPRNKEDEGYPRFDDGEEYCTPEQDELHCGNLNPRDVGPNLLSGNEGELLQSREKRGSIGESAVLNGRGIPAESGQDSSRGVSQCVVVGSRRTPAPYSQPCREPGHVLEGQLVSRTPRPSDSRLHGRQNCKYPVRAGR